MSDFSLDEKTRSVTFSPMKATSFWSSNCWSARRLILTEEGIRTVDKLIRVEKLYDP